MFHPMTGRTPLKLTTDEVVDLLVRLYGLDPAKESALRPRLKHFQRLGFPEGVNPGTGRVALYGVKQIFQLALAMELTALGLMPERITKLLLQLHSLDEIMLSAVGRDRVYLRVFTAGLDPLLSDKSRSDCPADYIDMLPADKISGALSGPQDEHYPRVSLIDLTELDNRLYSGLGSARHGEFIGEVRSWHSQSRLEI